MKMLPGQEGLRREAAGDPTRCARESVGCSPVLESPRRALGRAPVCQTVGSCRHPLWGRRPGWGKTVSLGLFRTGERCSLGARGPGQRLHVPSVQSSFRETSQGGVGFPQTHSVKLSELGSREAGGLALGSPLSELSPLRPAHPSHHRLNSLQRQPSQTGWGLGQCRPWQLLVARGTMETVP